MADVVEQFNKIPKVQKIAVTGLVVVAIFAVYYFVLYGELQDKRQNLEQQYGQLVQERQDYEKKKVEYISFKIEAEALREKQKDLLKKLPKKSEIPTFLESIHAQAEFVGLDIVSFERGQEQPTDLYFKIPVRMKLLGTYHQIAQFFKAVGDLKRIVNIENLELKLPGAIKKGGLAILDASFLASTFRFVEHSEASEAPAAAGAGGRR